jgi:polyhydroxyalkanoate synthesis regulator phasin
MTIDRGILDRIRARSEEVLTQISAELMSNPRFAKAMKGAMRGKKRVEAAAGKALRQVNVPTRSELKRALSRIESLEREVAALKTKVKTRRAGLRRPATRKPKAEPEAPPQ